MTGLDLGPRVDTPESIDLRHQVKLLIADALEMRTTAWRMGGHYSVTLNNCSPALLDAAERYGLRRLERGGDGTEWDYIAVCHGLVTFFGEERPVAVRERNPRGTGAEDDGYAEELFGLQVGDEDDEHTRSTVEMQRIGGGE